MTSAREPASYIPPRALALHAMRPDLSQAFDLNTDEGRERVYWWYYLHGFREFGFDPILGEDDIGRIRQPVPDLPQRGPLPVSQLMRALWRWHLAGKAPPRRTLGRRIARFWFGPSYDLRSASAQHELLAWFFARGLMEAHLGGLLTEADARVLLQHSDGTPRILSYIWAAEPALAQRFRNHDDPAFHAWSRSEGARLFPILAHRLIGWAPQEASPRAADAPFGVNLIGHLHGRSGVAEDLRMAAAALEAAGIPFAIRNVEPSRQVANEEDAPAYPMTNTLPYTISLFCMAGMEMMARVMAEGRDLLEARHNIGYWPWELPRWPALLGHAFGLVDEVWAASEFTANAYRVEAPVPVTHMPMAVDVSPGDGLNRSDFKLPAEGFLFAFAFDGHSTFARKNPEACLTAFAQAFPRGDEPVGLVLKGLRATDHPAWRQLSEAAARDPRIRIITDSLPRGALLDLYRAVDCFISLHRSEGFGRNIAECMALGKPVIVTAYSGNMDFTAPHCAALVPVMVRPIGPGIYPFGDRQSWAEPDIGAAAQAMRRMLADAPWRTALARAGQAFMETNHQPKIIGAAFRTRLEALANGKHTKGGVREYRKIP